jgi:hypothetical protein
MIACLYATAWYNESIDRHSGLLKRAFESKVSFVVTAVQTYSEIVLKSFVLLRTCLSNGPSLWGLSTKGTMPRVAS